MLNQKKAFHKSKMASDKNYMWTLFMFVCAVDISSPAPSSPCDPKYSPNVDATKFVSAIEKTSSVLEKVLTEEKIISGVITITGKSLKICEHLPVVGAAFGLLGVGVDIFAPKPDSTELKCMRAEFEKINQKLDQIEKKLEQVTESLNEIVKALKSETIYKEYNQYFKEPILRLFASYQNYIRYGHDGMTKYKQDSLIFSCQNDQPIFALDWLDRTLHNHNDPSGLPLLDFIFDTIKCDHDKVVAWTESVFYHAALAATLDQLCFATYVQQKHQPRYGRELDIFNQPEFLRVAEPANYTITRSIKVFQEREKKRQEKCFENTVNEMVENKLLMQVASCTCSNPLNMDLDRESCQPIAKLEAHFGLMDKTICFFPNPYGHNPHDTTWKEFIPKEYAGGIMLLNPMGNGESANACLPEFPHAHIYIRPGNVCDSQELEQREREKLAGIFSGKGKCFSNSCPMGFVF